MNVDREDEQTDRRIMTEALGVRVDRNDEDSEAGMFDFRFTMPDGRRGAAEMAAITDRGARERAALGGDRFAVAARHGRGWRRHPVYPGPSPA